MNPGERPDTPTEAASSGRLRDLSRIPAPHRDPADGPPPPPDLSAYGLEAKSLLGQGGMGTVYLARQRHPDRDVAVKVLALGAGYDEELRERFRREIHALSAVESPYIVPIYGTGTTPDGRPFYAMELVHGVPLEEYVNGKNLSQDERLRLFCLICRGVQAAHRQGIIHRDLKPSNILIDEEGRPRILDLGLAKFLGDGAGNWATISRVAQVMGTPAFMAPEQLQPDAQSVDTRADCYSLGVILYRLLLHAHPYPTPEGVLATMKVVGTREPVRPRELSPGLPQDLEAILLKALEKGPVRRYQSPDALAADIERFLDGLPVEAQIATTLYRFRKFVARHRLPVMVSAIAMVVIITLSAVSIVNIVSARRRAMDALRSERAAREELAREAYLNSLPAIEQRLHDRDFEQATAMLAQAPAEERSWEWQRLAHQSTPWLVTLGAGEGITCLAQLAGTECASGDAAGRLAIWDVASGQRMRSWQAHGEPVLTLSASHDGRELLSSDRNNAKLWNRSTGQLLATFPFRFAGKLGASLSPCFAPHGLFLLPGDKELRLVDRSGETKVSEPLSGPLTLCTASAKHGLVGWCEAYSDDSTGGSLRIDALSPDGGMTKLFWLRYPTHGLAVSDDLQRLAVAGLNETRIREQETGNFSVISRGRAGEVLRFLPGTHRLLMGSARGLEILEMGADERVESHIVTRTPPAAAFPDRQGKTILVLDGGAIHVLPVDPPAPAQLRGPAPGDAWLLAPDGGSVALLDGTLRVYDTGSGACIADFGTVSPTPSLLAYEPDSGGLLSTKPGCPSLTLHRIKTQQSIALPPCPRPIVALAASRAGQIAVQTTEAELFVYTPETQSWGKAATSIKLQPPPAILSFDAAGSQLAVGTVGGGLALVDPHEDNVLHLFPSGDYQEAVFSPDGKWLVMSGFDTATVWDCAESRVRGTLLPFSTVEGHRALQFTPDGRRIIVGESRGISLWDAGSCRKLCQESLPVKAIAASAFTKPGQLIVADEAGRLFVLEAVRSTSSIRSERDGELLRKWQGAAQARALPSASADRLVVCFVGAPADPIPGTPGAHAEEIAVWRSRKAHVCLRASPQIPTEDELAAIDVLRLCGPGTGAPPEELSRIRDWVGRGGRLFVTGTGEPTERLLKELGLPQPGQPEEIRIPPRLPGALPVWTPTGQYRLFGVARIQRFPATAAPPSPILAQTVGKGGVAAVLADSWCDDVPSTDSSSRACLPLGDNRLILQDCIQFLTEPVVDESRQGTKPPR